MEETHTFSQALHLMRYMAKKMKPIDWNNGFYFFVNGSELVQVSDGCEHDSTLFGDEIMGLWVEEC